MLDAPSPLVPGWLVRSTSVGWRLLVTAGMGVVVGIVVSTIPVSATATLVSLVVAAAIAPTVLRLRDRGLARSVAAAVAFGAAAALIVGVAILLLVVLVPDLRAVTGAVELGIENIRAALEELGVPEPVAAVYDRLAASIRTDLAPDPADLAGTLVDVGTVLVLGTFLTYFLLADGDRGWGWLMRSLKPWRVEAVTASARDGLLRVAWYVRRTAVLAALDAVVVAIVLGALGIPLAGALAAVAFLAGFVPYLGAITGGAVIALAALALGGAGPAAAALGALLAASIAGPRLLDSTAMNHSVDANPVVVLVAIPAGLALFGILGLFALLPVTVFALAVSRSVIAALDLGPAGSQHAAAGTQQAPPPDLPDGVPVWLDRVAQWSWRGLVLAGLAWLVIAVIVEVPSVVVPGLMAVVAAATLLPIVSRLVGRGWGRGRASAIATVGSALAIAAIVLAAVAMTLGPMREVMDAAVAGAAGMDLAWLADMVAEVGEELQVDLAAAFVGLVSLGLAMILAILMTYFFLRDGRTWWRALLARLSQGRRAPMAVAGTRAVEVLAGYMVGTAVISAFGGITTGLILVILGLPLALPVAVIGFFAGFIPYVGSFITTAIALLVTVALGDTADVVWMLVFTVVFNIAQGNFVTPLVYGRSLALHPAVVLMAIPVGNEVAGILGMFLVVPAAAMVAATWRLVLAAIDEAGLEAEAVDAGVPSAGVPQAGAPGGGPAPSHGPAPSQGDT